MELAETIVGLLCKRRTRTIDIINRWLLGGVAVVCCMELRCHLVTDIGRTVSVEGLYKCPKCSEKINCLKCFKGIIIRNIKI